MTIILGLLLVLGQQATADPPEDVVVVAKRVNRFRAVVRKDRKTGENRCHVRRKSGDPALDTGICAAMLACAPTITRERDIRPCMEPAMQRLVPTLSWVGTRARRGD